MREIQIRDVWYQIQSSSRMESRVLRIRSMQGDSSLVSMELLERRLVRIIQPVWDMRRLMLRPGPNGVLTVSSYLLHIHLNLTESSLEIRQLRCSRGVERSLQLLPRRLDPNPRQPNRRPPSSSRLRLVHLQTSRTLLPHA